MERGFLHLAGGEGQAPAGPVIIDGEMRPALTLRPGEVFSSPWVRLPRGAELQLGYGFAGGFGKRVAPADEGEAGKEAPAVNFSARLITA